MYCSRKENQFRFYPLDLRHGLFLIGLFTSLCTVVYPSLRFNTQPRLLIEIFTTGFQSLLRTGYLFLWKRLLVKFSPEDSFFPSYFFEPLSIAIFLSATISVWELIWYPIGQFMYSGRPWVVTVSAVTLILVPVIKYSLAAAFGWYAWKINKKYQQAISSVSKRALKRVFTI